MTDREDAIYGCPRCGNVDLLYCNGVTVWGDRAALVTPDGIDLAGNGGGCSWGLDDSAAMECPECGHRGPVASFSLG